MGSTNRLVWVIVGLVLVIVSHYVHMKMLEQVLVLVGGTILVVEMARIWRNRKKNG